MVAKGTKLTNQKSLFAQKQEEHKYNFNETVNNSVEKKENLFQTVSNLSIKFFTLIRDRTLVENKSSSKAEEEILTLKSLINICNSLNADPDQFECAGCSGLFALLIKAIFELKDERNNLENRISKLEKKLSGNG